jgi:hypothetical protein
MRARRKVANEDLLELLGIIQTKDHWGFARIRYWYNVFDEPLPAWAIEPGYEGYGRITMRTNKRPIRDKILQHALSRGYISQEQFDHILLEIQVRETLAMAEG